MQKSSRPVWILNHYAVPPEAPGSPRHHCLAEAWGRMGIYTRIFAARRTYKSRARDRRTLRHWGRRRSMISVNLIRVPTAGGEPSRLLQWLVFTAGAVLAGSARILRGEKPLAIIGSHVHLGAGFAAYALSRIARTTFLYEVRDIWPETLIAFGRVGRNTLVYRILEHSQDWLVRRSDAVITTMQYGGDYFSERGVWPKSKEFIWAPNGIPTSMILGQQKMRPHSGAICFGYCGSVGQSNGVRLVLEAARLVKHDFQDSECIILGDGSERMRLQSEFSAVATFLGAVPRTDVARYTARWGCAVLVVQDHPHLYRYGLSLNKMTDYLNAGLPIVIVSRCTTPWDTLPGVYVVRSYRPSDVAEAITQALELPLDAKKAIAASHREELYDRYGYDVIASNLIDRILQVSCWGIGSEDDPAPGDHLHAHL